MLVSCTSFCTGKPDEVSVWLFCLPFDLGTFPRKVEMKLNARGSFCQNQNGNCSQQTTYVP